MEELLQTLREFDALRDSGDHPDAVNCRTIARNYPCYDRGNLLQTLSPALQRALEALGINALYEHQTKAISLALQGKDVVLESPTASGKTLAFAIPMFERLLKEPSAYAMMIHPMKAISNDQRKQIQDLSESLPPGGRKIVSWPFDGDTPHEHRALLKASPPDIILTNPEMLHMSFLGWSEQWHRYLARLRFLVLDEIHEYRGYFGTNFALLLRRFLLKLDRLGAHPQLFLATATCANPLEHGRRLTGREFTLVKPHEKMNPRTHLAFINLGIPDYRFLDIFKLRIARAALGCLSQSLSTLVFCPSRRLAEAISKIARRDAEKYGLNPEVITVYKSGLTAEKRREIEEGMRTGKYQAVFSTNALELGIDIGRLDVCILAGFPDSVMSAWQRIGRTGRSWNKDVYVLFYAMNNPFDRFYADNIDAFLGKPLDEIAIGIDNEELIDHHIPYLLHETSWTLAENDRRVIGQTFYQRAMQKSSQSKPMISVRGPNYKHLNIRGASGDILSLKCGGKDIGTMSSAQRFREAYIGAVYNHCGEAYRVVGYGEKEIQLEKAEPHLRTEPSFYTIVQSCDVLKALRYAHSIGVFYGKLTIYENFSGYKLVDDRTGDVLYEQRSTDARKHLAHAFWLAIEDVAALEKSDSITAVRALEQLLRIGAAFIIPCDRHDTSTISFRGTQYGPSVYLYENVPGGIGIAEKTFTIWRDAIREGMKIAERCPCRNGCPRCIHPPRRKDASEMSKLAGLELARDLLHITSSPPTEEFDADTHGWRGIDRGTGDDEIDS